MDAYFFISCRCDMGPFNEAVALIGPVPKQAKPDLHLLRGADSLDSLEFNALKRKRSPKSQPEHARDGGIDIPLF